MFELKLILGGPASSHEAETGSFGKKQLDYILKLLKSNSGLLGARNASLAHSGNNCNVLVCHSFFASWIIDSGASDYMASVSNFFHNYNPSSSYEKICIADGSILLLLVKVL